jgi:hypothetical protein
MNDLISRQMAIDAAMQDVSDKRSHDFNAGATRAANRIKLLPSAEKEEIIRCKDCKHRPKAIEGYVENDGFSLEFQDFECPCRCDDPYYNWMPKDDWYCGNGERKEE